MPSGSKCLADLCGALHCDAVMNTKSSKTKCNPASVARNHHLCEGLANSCFPINQSPSARRLNDRLLFLYLSLHLDLLVEFFLHQFCHAHTCSGKRKLFPRGGKMEIKRREKDKREVWITPPMNWNSSPMNVEFTNNRTLSYEFGTSSVPATLS
ncbi:hypothetical protein DVH24_008593 [Malus domestica]|uniref:Uncharacterized protein n=1 Tax=Malus domestica TaxID=3750 RepID=A0A498JQE6_MALDO|nr:hypothetical protein DVH24_008593 [Malus domestica]